MTKKTSTGAAAAKLYYKKRFTNGERHGILKAGKDTIEPQVHKESPGIASSEAFILGCAVLFIIPIQPLAYVVGNYTCHNGD